MDDNTRFEILIGLHITDDESYDKYRAGMTPLLKEHGGYFRYDFQICEMLQGNASEPLNRVFIISFPDENTKDQFFADKAYLKVRNNYFDQAVSCTETLASFYSPLNSV